MPAGILVYALHYEGAFNKNSLGAVSEGAKLAAELGGDAHAILLGENVPHELAATLGDRMFLTLRYRHSKFDDTSARRFAQILRKRLLK